jgi:group I intron endonuclease
VIFQYNGAANKPGIYKITNTMNGRVYIGQAKELKSRWNDYRRQLPTGKGHNRFLCNDYLKCLKEVGNDDFLVFTVVEVLEGSTKEQRNQKEEHYIAEHWDKQHMCYNFQTTTPSKERSCQSLQPMQTREKLSAASKAAWQSTAYRTSQLARLQKRWNDPEEKKKLSQRMKEQWQEEGRKEKYGKKISDMWTDPAKREVLLGKLVTPEFVEAFKAKCHNQASWKKMAETNTKNHGKLLSPTGDVFEVVGLKAFCETHLLPLSAMRAIHQLAQGKIPSYHGWRKYKYELIGVPYVKEDGGREFALLSPEGELHTGSNVTAFCRAHGLQQQNITQVLLGNRHSHKGWKRATNI